MVAPIFYFVFFFSFLHSADNWQEIFKKDMMAIVQTLQKNHPGYVDSENPSFKAKLDQYKEFIQNEEKKVLGCAEYVLLIKKFLNQFKDSHLGIIEKNDSISYLYAGFRVQKEGDQFKVIESKIPQITLNDRLISCDALSPKEWLKQEVFQWKGNKDILGHYFLYAKYLTLFEDSPLIKKPHSYSFEKPNGKVITIPSSYIPYKDTLNKKIYTLPAVKKSKSQKGLLIELPSFILDSKEGLTAFAKILSAITEAKKNDTDICFDLRGNSGGNSAYGELILKELFGEQYFQYMMNQEKKKRGEVVEWRASKENLSYLESLQRQLKKDKLLEDELYWIESVIRGVKKAIKNNEDYFKEYNCGLCRDIEIKPENQLKEIRLLIDEHCASATLDFIYGMMILAKKAQTKVSLQGNPTNADSLYMEVREKMLPSQYSELFFPMKVYRKRKNNEGYLPDC